MRARTVARLRDLPAASWDALFPADYPFTRHAFLSALDETGCVGRDRGWEPCHRVVEDAQGRLLAALPCYAKQHSWGEFVFDWSWARAAQELGIPYYPKLLAAIPFTPVTGPRLGAVDAPARAHLLKSLLDGGQDTSSFHALFLDDGDADLLGRDDLWQRHDIQFHWFNHGDATFAGFLARLTHDKRKKILRERRRVAEAGLRFEARAGDTLNEAQWAQVYALYANTYEERGQPPYLTLDFFLDYGRRPGTPVRLVLAWQGAGLVAVAITLAAGGVLYGRHWGCAERYHSLHFETCYYQGIELCLREGFERFDAGAQGEHKLARGFEPVITRSVHRLNDARLHGAIGSFLERERAWVERQRGLLAEHSPYRRVALEATTARHG